MTNCWFKRVYILAFALLLQGGSYGDFDGAGFIKGALAEDRVDEALGNFRGSERRLDGILAKTATGVGLALAGSLLGHLLGRRIFPSRNHKAPMEHYRSPYVLPSAETNTRREYCRFFLPVSALTNGKDDRLFDGDVAVTAIDSGRSLEFKCTAQRRVEGASGEDGDSSTRTPFKIREVFRTIYALPGGCEYSRHLDASFTKVIRDSAMVGVEVQVPQEEFAFYEPSADKMPPPKNAVPSVDGLGVVSVGHCHYEVSGGFLQPVDPGSVVLASSLRQFRIFAKRDGAEVSLAQMEYPCGCRPDLHHNVVFWIEEMDVDGKVGVKVYVKVFNQPWDMPLGECFSQPLVQMPPRAE